MENKQNQNSIQRPFNNSLTNASTVSSNERYGGRKPCEHGGCCGHCINKTTCGNVCRSCVPKYEE